MWQIVWISKDGKKELMDSEYETLRDAQEAVKECRAAFIEQGMSAAEVDAGKFEVEATLGLDGKSKQ